MHVSGAKRTRAGARGNFLQVFTDPSRPARHALHAAPYGPRMCPEVSLLPTFLAAAIAAFSVLGGIMAAISGFLAARAYWPGQMLSGLTDAINQGIALGFTAGALPAAAILILSVTS